MFNFRKTLDVKNNLKSFFLTLLNFAIFGFIFYLAVGFNSVWFEYGPVLVVMWIFVLIIDLIVFELLLEGLIFIIYRMRSYRVFMLTLRLLFMLRELRNLS